MYEQGLSIVLALSFLCNYSFGLLFVSCAHSLNLSQIRQNYKSQIYAFLCESLSVK